MKLLYCIPSLENCGGTERVLTTRLNHLIQDEDVDVYIVLTETQATEPYFKLDPRVNVIQLGIDFNADRTLADKLLNYHRRLRQYRRKLADLLQEIRPDIVTSFLSHEIDFLARLRDGSVKVGENHFNRDFRYFFVKNNTSSLLHRLIARYRNHRIGKDVRQLDMLVCLTDNDSKAWGVECQTVVIPNPLSFTSEDKSDCSRHKIISVGRLAREKGYDMLLEAWRQVADQHPSWTLDIYGEGEEHDNLKTTIDSGIRGVEIHPFEQNIASKLVESSIFVLSSRFEGFGLVLIEAMECGLPVVAFDCKSGPAEIISHGKEGLLVRESDVKALAEAMERLMDDQQLRTSFGQNAALKASCYAADDIMNKWKELYRTLLAK